MATLDALQPLVTTTITLRAGQSIPSSLAMIVVSEHTYWTDRVVAVSYTSQADLLAQLVDLGVPEGSAEYRAAYAISNQPSRPYTLYFGRRDPVDATWAAALDAIRTASDAWWGGVVLTRADTEIREIADWQKAQSVGGWIWQVADPAVKAEGAGNLAEYLRGLSKPTGALLWHDPATASGAAAPYFDTTAGPWDLPPGGVLGVLVDQGASVPYQLAARPADVTGSNAGPFVGADGQTLAGSVEGVAFAVALAASAATATTLTPAAPTWDLTAAYGNTVYIETEAGPENYAIGAGAAFAPGTATPAQVAADFAAALTLATAAAVGLTVEFSSVLEGTASRFRFAAGTDAAFLAALGLTAGTWYAGGGNVADVLAYTAAELGTLIQADIGVAGTAVDDGAGALEITGGIYGTASNITITSGSAALLTAVGLSVGSTSGTGDVANAADVQPLELHPLLAAAYGAASVAVTLRESNTVIRVAGTAGVGRWHTLQAVGELRTPLGITSGLIRGAGTEDDHADAAWAGILLSRDLTTARPRGGLVTADNQALVECYGDDFPGPSGRARSTSLRENACVNTLEQWTARRRGPETHDGRACWLLDGQPVYFEAMMAMDQFAISLQAAYKAGLDAAADNNQPVPYTTADVRAAVASWLMPVITSAAAAGLIGAPDLSPPDPVNGKETGFEVIALAQSTALDRSLRRARIYIKQELAASLQRGYIAIELINA